MTIRILRSFWVLVALLALFMGQNSPYLFVEIGVIIIFSVLIHEMGHALMLRLFGKKPHIELTGYGGTTYAAYNDLSSIKNFVVIIMGPLFGFFTAFLASYCVPLVPQGNISLFLAHFAQLNFFWSVVNLIPVLPLDGGRCLVIFSGIVAPQKKYVVSFFLSIVFALVIALISLFLGYVMMTALFLLFAFESYSGWKYSKDEELDSEVLFELTKAHEEWALQNTQDAISRLESLAARTKMHRIEIVEKLASYYLLTSNPKKAYTMLLPRKNKLSSQGCKFLQLAAYQIQEYQVALEVGRMAFVELVDTEVALLNAFCSGRLNLVDEAINWLMRLQEMQTVDMKSLKDAEDFEAIKMESRFLQVVS